MPTNHPRGEALCLAMLLSICCAPIASAQDASSADSGDSPAEHAPALEEGADLETGIRGRVSAEDLRQGLESAPVLITGRGRTRAVIADETGSFIAHVPPGHYTVRSYYDLYHGARYDRLRVRRGHLLDLNLVLAPIEDAEVPVEEIEVAYAADTSSEAAQLELRRARTSVEDSVGAEEMSRSGDGSAQSAARRVVGVSVEGSQLVVRGLGGRYSRTLLNGVSVPSTDPDVPGVALDIFPTSMLRSLSVVKTARADLPADFAGGLLLIDTTSFPTEPTLELGVSMGGNTASTLRQRLDYEGGSLDAVGFDDGGRSIPSSVPRHERLDISRGGSFQSFAALESVAKDFKDRWQWRRRRALPNFGVNLTAGDAYSLGSNTTFGFLTSASYDHSEFRRTGLSRARPNIEVADDGSYSFSPFDDFRVETGGEAVRWGALGSFGLRVGRDHEITLLTMYNRSAEDTTQRQTGQAGEIDGFVDKWQLDFLARDISFHQLRGDHRNLGGTRMRLRWNLFAATGSRSEPDRRTVIYGPNGGVFRWLEKSGSGERYYSQLHQRDLGGGASLRFPLWSQGWATVGGRVRDSSRQLTNRRFRMLQAPSATDQTVYADPVETLFGAADIGPVTRIREFTRPDDSYTSTQRLYAAYAMLETPLFAGMRLAAGARFEGFDQTVQSRDPVASGNTPADLPGTSRLDQDILPSASLVLPINDHIDLRAGYGMTVSRPQVRELAPYQYFDFLRDRNVTGNPDLRRTRIHNLDLRLEIFGDGTNLFAVSGFYKYFKDPIELVISDPTTYDATFRNAAAARTFGAEFEGRLALGALSDSLKRFSFGGNFALIRSRIQLRPEDAGAVRANRALAGQSPYLVNMSLRFDDPDTGLTASIVYNVVGPRISDVGVRASSEIILPNIVEQAFHSIDFVASYQASSRLVLKLKIKNIALSTRDYRQGGFLVARRVPGMSGSVGLTLSY
ncbi:MAG: TonB-dependent receptor [Deltaproteobacteria bacterium]|nr:TonB-dependent receptor [Deltaproteobacteria bacterium]